MHVAKAHMLALVGATMVIFVLTSWSLQAFALDRDKFPRRAPGASPGIDHPAAGRAL
jgi:hypothetical protein